jgi:hypothetical protein
MQNTRFSCGILMKFQFSPNTFKKVLNIKFYQNLSSGSPTVERGPLDKRTDRQTDRYDEANSRFSQFFERA